MVMNLDVTGEKLEEMIYFEKGWVINSFFPYNQISTFNCDFWGGHLWLDPKWDTYPFFGESINTFKSIINPLEDLYIAGRGHLKIEGIVNGNVEIFPYQSNNIQVNLRNFSKNNDGSLVKYTHFWDTKKPYTESYELEFASFWPPQAMNINFQTFEGKATFTFDTDDIITVKEYRNIKNGYQKYELETNLEKLEESYRKYPHLGE